jgi:alpha-tubulin suppressor-like RCC1 family protein
VPFIAAGAQKDAQVFATINAVQIPCPLKGRNLLKTACGESHDLFLSDNLKIMSCGSNIYGQLGNGTNIEANFVGQMPQTQSIQGQQQTLSQLQVVDGFIDNEDVKEVVMSSQNQEFVHIACGAEHSFALSTTGELYSWGLGFKGQLGHGDFENKLRPTLVKNMSPSFLESGMEPNNQNSSKRSKSRDKNANANQNKSMDLSDINNFSDDQHTGLPEHDDEILRQLNQMTQEIINEDKANNLYLLQSKEKVEQVECGSIHTVLRTNVNRLFSCGNGATYALGHGSRESLRTFKQI